MKQIDPLKFFSKLKWIDGRPLLDVIEPYRRVIFQQALYTFDGARPKFNLILTGRAKKNWKSADMILAALYRLLGRRAETNVTGSQTISIRPTITWSWRRRSWPSIRQSRTL